MTIHEYGRNKMISKSKNPDPVARQDDGSGGGNVDSRCSPQLVVTQPGRKQKSSKENTGWWLSSQGGATSARRLILRQGRNHCGHHSIHSAAKQEQKETKTSGHVLESMRAITGPQPVPAGAQHLHSGRSIYSGISVACLCGSKCTSCLLCPTRHILHNVSARKCLRNRSG